MNHRLPYGKTNAMPGSVPDALSVHATLQAQSCLRKHSGYRNPNEARNQYQGQSGGRGRKSHVALNCDQSCLSSDFVTKCPPCNICAKAKNEQPEKHNPNIHSFREGRSKRQFADDPTQTVKSMIQTR